MHGDKLTATSLDLAVFGKSHQPSNQPRQVQPPADATISREELVGSLLGSDSQGAALSAEMSIGYRLLIQMGWRPGTGLGRANTGQVEPVSASLEHNKVRAGLGASAAASAGSKPLVGTLKATMKILRRLEMEKSVFDFTGAPFVCPLLCSALLNQFGVVRCCTPHRVNG